MNERGDDELDDPLPALRAQLDQMIATMPEMARCGWSWFHAFKEAGFDDNQAMYLTAVELVQNPGKTP